MGARWVPSVVVVTACTPVPDNLVARDPLLTVDRATARVSTNAGAPIQFAIEFADAGVRMPQALLLDGTNRVGTGSCPTESGVGIGVYPAVNAVAPVHGGPTATGSLEIVWGGPVIAKVQVTWATQYTCPGNQQANGTSTFTIFPNGRIVRDDVAKPSTTTLTGGTACGCSSDDHFYFTSFWTLVQGAQNVNPDGTAAVDGMPSGCAVYPNHTIGFAWPDGSTRITTLTGVSGHVHDWSADALTLPPDERQLVSAIMLSEETAPASCAQVLADLDDFPITVAGTMVFTDDAGIYVDARSHTDPVVIAAPRRVPKGFAISLDVGEFAELTRSPELDGDWYFVQVDGDHTVFWFPDGLDVGQTITIDPR